jgi:hypothetical protein
MALTLIVEDGSIVAGANTWISMEDAESYMEARLHTTTWDDATDPDKRAALVQAARIMGSYVDWLGWLTDEDQALKWPRWGICYDGTQYWTCSGLWLTDERVYTVSEDSIPQAVVDAQCELALHLLSSDTQAVPDTAGFSEIEVEGAVSLKVDKQDRTGTIPVHVWDMIRHFGSRKSGANVQLMRG